MELLRRSIQEIKKSKEGTAGMTKIAATLYKKFGLGAITVVAFLIVPLAVQALSDANEPAQPHEQASEAQDDDPAPATENSSQSNPATNNNSGQAGGNNSDT